MKNRLITVTHSETSVQVRVVLEIIVEKLKTKYQINSVRVLSY